MNLKPEDIVVSLVKANHEHRFGSWSNQTLSGIVLYHKPTGIQVKCTKHKSQWKNKEEAVEFLKEEVRKEQERKDIIGTFSGYKYAVGILLETEEETLFGLDVLDNEQVFYILGSSRPYSIDEVMIFRVISKEELFYVEI